MKLKIRFLRSAKTFTLIIITLAFFVVSKSVFASTFYLSPGKGNVAVGGTITVQVRLNAGGDAVNGVSAYLSYPQDKLEVAWVSPTSTFGIEAEKSFGGGIIKISRGNFSGVSGNVSVASIGFRGKAPGSATVAFIGGSQAPRASDSSDSLNLGGSAGGVYQVGGSAPAPTKSSSKTTKSTLSAEVQTGGFQISDVVVSDISTNSATVSWKTNREADSVINYGLEKDNYFLSLTDSNLTTEHKLQIKGPLLLPGLKMHFIVNSKDADGNVALSQDQILQLIGAKIKVKVVDSLGKAVSGAKVTLYSDPQQGQTDINGEVIFDNVTSGKHLVVVKFNGLEKTSEVEVSSVSKVQGADINLGNLAKKSNFSLTSQSLIIIVAIIILVLIMAVILFIKIRRKNTLNKPNDPTIPVSV